MREDVEAADLMLTRLSELLRVTLEGADVQEVTLKHELELLQRYLDIQQVRFGPRLGIRTAIDPAALDLHVPTLLLQPLVENAIRHGVSSRPGRCQLALSARLSGETLRVDVRDDGPGPPEESQPASQDADPSTVGHGVGLDNTRARLRELYGPRASLTLERHPEGGAVARVILPAVRADHR